MKNFIVQFKRSLRDRQKVIIMLIATFVYVFTSILLFSLNDKATVSADEPNINAMAVSEIASQETQRAIDMVNEANKTKQEEIDKVSDEIVRMIQEDDTEEEENNVPEPYYNPYNVTESSNMTYEEMRDMLQGNKLQSISHVFIDCEQKYGINALFLFGMAALESAHGTSYRAQTQNNLTGFAVYTDTSEGSSFSSWEECIETTAIILDRDYLSESGTYYVGPSSWNVNVYWAKNSTWAEQINDIINEYIYNYKN